MRSGPDHKGPSVCGRIGADVAEEHHEEKDGCAFQDPHYDGPRKCKGKDYRLDPPPSQIYTQSFTTHTHPFEISSSVSNLAGPAVSQTPHPEAGKCLNAQAPCEFTSDCCSGLACQSNANDDGLYCCFNSGQLCYSDNDCCSLYCVQNAQGAGTCE